MYQPPRLCVISSLPCKHSLAAHRCAALVRWHCSANSQVEIAWAQGYMPWIVKLWHGSWQLMIVRGLQVAIKVSRT